MTAADMSAPTITSKDDVQCLEMRDAKDISNPIGARYYCWVPGAVDEDDALYVTKLLDGPSSGHSVEQVQGALARVPNQVIFPPLPIPWWFARTGVTVSDSWDAEPDPEVYYLKRPWVSAFGTGNDVDDVDDDGPLAHWFACEVRNLEQLARHPAHPHLVRYHGCRVRGGHITGALLGRVPGGTTLDDYARAGKTVPDKPAFLRALASAVHHLHHVVGLVHNDIHPGNIMVSPDGSTPTLIDLGSALPDGEEMLQCQPWVYYPPLFFFLSKTNKEAPPLQILLLGQRPAGPGPRDALQRAPRRPSDVEEVARPRRPQAAAHLAGRLRLYHGQRARLGGCRIYCCGRQARVRGG